MKARPELLGCLLLAACRQPNPEWTGHDEGSDTGPEATDVGESADSTTDALATETGVETEGKRCNNDNMCPDGLVCGPMGCQDGSDGDPCTRDGDCTLPSSICGPMGTCQDGSDGDPCTSDGDCVHPTSICGPTGTCQDGSDGDPCTGDANCVHPTPICGSTGTCQDGSAGDPCTGDGQCTIPTPICGPEATCQEGAAGDPCAGASDCADGLACMDAVCG